MDNRVDFEKNQNSVLQNIGKHSNAQTNMGRQSNVNMQNNMSMQNVQQSVGMQNNMGMQNVQQSVGMQNNMGMQNVQQSVGMQNNMGMQNPQQNMGMQGNMSMQNSQQNVGMQGNMSMQNPQQNMGMQNSQQNIGIQMSYHNVEIQNDVQKNSIQWSDKSNEGIQNDRFMNIGGQEDISQREGYLDLSNQYNSYNNGFQDSGYKYGEFGNQNEVDDEGFKIDLEGNEEDTEKYTFGMWIKEHKVLTVFLSLLLVAAISVITYVVINTGKDGNNDDTEYATTDTDTDDIVDEDIPLEDGEEDVNGEVDNLYAELNEGAEKKEVVTTPVTDLSNVKKAPVDDTSDPQPKQNVDSESKSAGAVVSVDKVVDNAAQAQTSAKSIGIDVSKWQGSIDWTKVAASGIDFAFIRIGYRTTVTGEVFEDPYALYNMQQAQKAGIKIGVYFYSTAITAEEGKAEAQWVCDKIAKYKITYPVVFDYEGYEVSGNRNYGIKSLAKTEIAKAFLDVVKAAGYTPMLYASKSALETEYNTAVLNGNYKIWVSQYPSTPYPQTAKSTYTGKHDMWQYTSKGKVDGVSGYVDVNVSYLEYNTVAAAKDSTEPETVTIDPEIGITFKSVNEEVTPKIYVNIRSVPNSVDDSTIVGTIKNGEFLTRTGIGDNGWSRLEYNGKKVYAVTSYLTTDLGDNSQAVTTKTPDNSSGGNSSGGSNGNSLPAGYTAVNVQVTPKDKVNLRSAPGSTTSDTIVASVSNGEILDKIGEGANGWSIISYNGKNVYAVTSFLTEDLSYKTATAAPSTSTDGVYTTVNEQVTAKSSTNLRSVASSASSDTIVYKLTAGEYVTRTGIGSNGWSRLEYNGQTVYAITTYLTTDSITATDAPAPEPTENTTGTTETEETTE